MKKEYLECGRVCTAHGVRGFLKVEPWCDSPSVLAMQKRVFFAEKDGSYKETKVLSASVSTRFVLMLIEGVSDREAAQALKNKTLYLHRNDIPVEEGAVLIADMIGLDVIDVDSGRVYGKLTEVNDGVQAKLYTVKTKSGDVLLPAVPEFVVRVDVEDAIYIRPIPGLLDGGAENV